MKILIALKSVPDFKTQVRLKADASGIDTAHVKMSINPFDEIAMEEAVRLKEKGIAKELLAVSIGPSSSQEMLRTALAMGADRAILLQTEQEMQPLSAARILQTLTAKENPQMIIMGKQAIDTDNNQTGQMLAGLLNWPQGTFVSKLQFDGEWVQVTREIDGGLETLSLKLPALITTDLRLNEPRYISLPNIVQAKRKPLEVIPLESINIQLIPGLKTLMLALPAKRRAGVRVADAKELVQRLKEEAKIL